MATISSPGIGSGLDINGLVTKLMAAERTPETAMIKKETDAQAKLTAFGTVKGAVASFQTAVQSLSASYQFTKMAATVSDSTIATATATSTAALGSHSLSVTQLAQSHSLKSAAFTSVDQAIGTGTLTIQFGQITGELRADGTYKNPADATDPSATPATFAVNAEKSSITVNLSGGNNTLSAVRDAINAKGAGVTASIINDGSGFRLVLNAADGGAKSSMRIQVSDDDTNNTDASGLSQLAYDPTQAGGAGQNMTQTQQAKDAIFALDGITVTRSSNTVSDVLSGISISLLKTTTAATSLSVSRDTSSVQGNVDAFVKGYNDLRQQLSSLTSYDPKTKAAGLLLGNSAIRSIQNQMRSVVNSTLAGSGNYTRLSDVGISFDKTGTMTFDSSKLSAALSTSPDSVAALFGVYATSSDSQVRYVSSTGATKAGSYSLFMTQQATQGMVRGTSLGATPFPLTVDANNNTFAVKVNGTQSSTITLTQGSYASSSAMAAEIQSKINGDSTLKASGITVAVAFDANKNSFSITSANYGSSSSVELTSAGTDFATSFGLSIGKQATLFGSTLQSKTIDSTNDTLTLKVDGGAATTLTLTQGSYATGALLATEIQTQINAAGLGADVSFNATANRLEFSSRTPGTSSAVEITGVGTATANTLGLGVSKGVTTGLDVAGLLGDNAASGSGQFLTGQGNAAGLSVQVMGGVSAPDGVSRGAITFNKGFAYQLNSVLSSILGDSGTLASASKGLQTQIDGITKQVNEFETRMVSTEARYRAQFNKLDTTIASLQQTSSYLTTQLANLPK